MSVQQFRDSLRRIAYKADESEIKDLIESLKDARTDQVDLKPLSVMLDKISKNKTINLKDDRQVVDRIAKFPINVKKCLNEIEHLLQSTNMTVDEFFHYLDKDGNQHVDRKEFVDGILVRMQNNKNTQRADLGALFDHLDHNNDGDLTKNEFASFIKGLDLTKAN